VLNLEDEHGGDEKLICVPVDSTFPYYKDVRANEDLPSIVIQQIEHFFTHYKDLEKPRSGCASASGATLPMPSG
jgi:inorganic pyrophosphatase